MAYITFGYCKKCEAQTQYVNGYCCACLQREEREKIAAWNALTVEEKLQDLRRRVDKLEDKTDLSW